MPELEALANGADLVQSAAPVNGTEPPAAVVDRSPAIVLFSAPVGRRPAVEALLGATGLAFRVGIERRRREQVFRGSVSEEVVTVLAGEVMVRADQAADLREQLRDAGVRTDVRPATPEDLRRLDPGRARGTPDAPRPVPADAFARDAVVGPAPAQPVLHLELSEAAGALIDRIKAHPALAGLVITVSPTVRSVRSTYRGSEVEIRRAGLDLAVSCPPARMDQVRAVLAGEAGVREGDVGVEPPGTP